MSDDWLDILLNGAFEVTLPTLTLGQKDSAQFLGSGHLNWQVNSGVRVQAKTNGAEELSKNFGHLGISPGKIIPPERHILAMGCTPDGWDVQTSPVSFPGLSLHWDSPHVIWDFVSPGLSLTRAKRNHGRGHVLRGLLGPPPKRWIRATETEVHNKYFGLRSFELDWLLVETRLGPVAARQRSNQWFEIKVEVNEVCPDTKPLDILFVVATAFSFVLGRRVFIRGFEDNSADRETRYLEASDQEPSKNHLPMPLGNASAYQANIEALVSQAIDFFSTPSGKQVAQYLYLYWNTADDLFPTQLAVASIAVEGLLQVASESSADKDPGWTSADRTLLEKWLKESRDRLSTRFGNRVEGFMVGLDHKRPMDILRDWQARGLLAINDDDIKAWRETRNPAVHARFSIFAPEYNKLQTQFNDFYRVLNLMNRIVLQLIGYSGLYVDYAQPNWPETDFPLATF